MTTTKNRTNRIQVGDRVVVICTDGKRDPGVVLSTYADGGPHIKFDDGTYCTVPDNRVVVIR